MDDVTELSNVFLYDRNLIYFVDRLQGFSTNVVKIETQNKSTAKANDIVSLDLPSNVLVHTRSLKMHCNATTKAADAGGVECGARLPPIDDLVERCETSLGGTTISQGQSFLNVYNEAQMALGEDSCDAVFGHPEYVRAKSYVNGTAFTGLDNEHYPSDALSRFCITKFGGFLATVDPKIIDTSILPEMRLRLHMASDNVLTRSTSTVLGATGFTLKSTTAGSPKYMLTDIHATLEIMQIADKGYEMMVSRIMGATPTSYIELPFKQVTSFAETHSGSSRFTVSTGSLDAVVITWRKTTYDQQEAPLVIQGHKVAGGFVAGTSSGTVDVDHGVSQYDTGGVLNTDTEKYKSQYFNFIRPQEAMTMNLQLNGANYPQFAANLGELYGITKNSLQTKSYENKKMTLDQYMNNYCVQKFRLNMLDAEETRTQSGLDTRAVNLSGYVNTNGTSGSPNLAINIFCEATSVLRVGVGRQIELVA